MRSFALFLALIAMFNFGMADGVIYRSKKDSIKQSELLMKSKFFPDSNVVEIIEASPDTQILMKALKAANLDDVLEGPGPFMIFAPNNQAFEKLGKEKLNALLQPKNRKELRKILLYHVVPGHFISTELKSIKAPTANGNELNIEVKNDESVHVNQARVIDTELEGSNGVIYIIDEVLTP